jgi:hypothetical protein
MILRLAYIKFCAERGRHFSLDFTPNCSFILQYLDIRYDEDDQILPTKQCLKCQN